MKIREVSDEDITVYAINNGGRNIRNIFKEIKEKYSSLITDVSNLKKHRTLIDDMKDRISDLSSDIVDLHNSCLNCEDDDETRTIATSMKTMYSELEKIFNLL